jgi:DNA-binding transcriptional ArsR family regulator
VPLERVIQRAGVAGSEVGPVQIPRTRIRVLELLADGPVRVSELRKATDLEASNLSQHLGVLRRQRLIASSRTDGQIHYRLSCPEVLPLLTVASALLRSTLHSTRLQLFDAGAPSRES